MPLRLVGDDESERFPVELPDESTDVVFERVVEDEKCTEYRAFEQQLPPGMGVTSQGRVIGAVGLSDVWRLIDDAVDGTGGFVDGGYLVPHLREFNKSTRRLEDKFLARCALSTYDNFVAPIVNTPWNYINESRDAIERKFGDGFPASWRSILEAFWLDADARGSDVVSTIAWAAQQARRFGTGWVFVDRPDVELRNARDDASTPVYAYCPNTRDVVWWHFDDDYALDAVAVREPWVEVTEDDSIPPYDLRIWTKTAWAVYGPTGIRRDDASAVSPSGSWVPYRGGVNPLGEIPVVQLFDRHPGPGRGLGVTLTPTVARLAMTVYNIDSEIREIQRNAGFPILAVPMRDPSKVNEIVFSTETAMGFSDQGGQPLWLTQALSEAKALWEDREAKKQAAYAMEHMAAVVGYVQTSSGFHSEAEFDKTNRRIGDFASSVEGAENKVARLVLRWRGMPDTPEANATVKKGVSIDYPRDYGIHDWDAQVKRLGDRLALNLGEEDAAQAILDYYAVRYPRDDKEALKLRAARAAKARHEAQRQATMGGAAAGNGNGGADPRSVAISQRLVEAMAGRRPAPRAGAPATPPARSNAATQQAGGRNVRRENTPPRG